MPPRNLVKTGSNGTCIIMRWEAPYMSTNDQRLFPVEVNAVQPSSHLHVVHSKTSFGHSCCWWSIDLLANYQVCNILDVPYLAVICYALHFISFHFISFHCLATTTTTSILFSQNCTTVALPCLAFSSLLCSVLFCFCLFSSVQIYSILHCSVLYFFVINSEAMFQPIMSTVVPFAHLHTRNTKII